MEKELGKEIEKEILSKGNNISMISMIIGAILITALASKVSGILGFFIIFLSIMFNIILGGYIAYKIGNSISKRIS